MNPALLSSKNMCWCTPQDFFNTLMKNFILAWTQQQPQNLQNVRNSSHPNKMV